MTSDISTGQTTKVQVDVETATREELVAEIERLATVCKRWSDSFQAVCKGNAEGWAWQVTELQERVEMLEKLL